MPTEVDVMRELVRDYWAGRPIPCPKHPGVKMTGSFVQTTFADHVVLSCPRGESITIPQRPKQIEFQAQQVEGFVENLQRRDKNLCYRCQSPLVVEEKANPTSGIASYTFTCVRCFSFGRWMGHPETAKIGSSPTAGTAKKSKSG
jgi:hypothetical protein